MKTTRFFIYMMMAAMVFACQKENSYEGAEKNQVFTARIEQPVETKAYLLSGNMVGFTSGDKIRVYTSEFGGKKSFQCSATGTEVTFAGTIDESDCYYAIYKYLAPFPADCEFTQVANISAGSSGYEVKYDSNVYPVQVAEYDGFDPNALGMGGKAGKDKEFKFVQLTSLVKFELKKAGVSKVVLKSLNEGVLIAGRYNVLCSDSDDNGWFDTFKVGTANNDVSNSITLLPPSGMTEFPQGVYYIVTRPERNCSGGLSLTFYDSSDMELKTFKNTEKVQLRIGKIRYLGSFTW